MYTHDPVNLDAFERLLAQPDPKDLPRRTHVSRYAGDPDRRSTRLPKIFMAWLQRHYLESDLEEGLAAPAHILKFPARPSPRLKAIPMETANASAGMADVGSVHAQQSR